MEVAQPLSQGEKNFKALHGDLKPSNRDMVPGITDQDFLFNGKDRKMDPKTASYENDEESKKEYDKTLKVKEEIEAVDEARLAMPLKGHAYHTKTHAELKYIQKDASEAAKANKGRPSEGKYLDQVNDASTVLHYRSKGGKQVTNEETVDEAMKGEDEYNARYGPGGKKKKPALDPVGKEDDDVNNDGKVNSSDSYLKNRRKVVGKYLNKEDVEVAEAMKGQAEYDARYGKGGKKKPDPTKDKPKAKTDWKEMLTKKKEVSEEVIEEDVFSHVKSFRIGDYMTSVHEDTNGNYLVINPVTDEEYFTEDYEDACAAAKAILRTEVKNIMAEEAIEEAKQKKVDVEKAMYARYTAGKFTRKPNPDKKKVEGSVKEESESIDEKHLTSAEKKKREEIAQAIAKKHPEYPMGKKMAIATAQAEKVAEEVESIEESKLGYHEFEVEYEKKKYSGDPDTVKKTEKYKVPREFHGQTAGSHTGIMNRIKGHSDSAATHNKHKAAGFNVSEKPIKFRGVNEEAEPLDEISRDLASRYIQKAKTSTRDAYYGDDDKTSNKRKTGIDLALLKKWGDKKFGYPEPKVKATEDVDTARAAHAKAKELENQGHDAERMGDEKTMRRKFADMALQKLKSKAAMKNVKEEKEKSKIHCSQCGASCSSSGVDSPYKTGFSHCKDHKKLGLKMVKEAVEPKPKSMVPQAREDLKKTKELYKKVDAVSKEMKNPGYDVNDRINHFRIKKHLHDIYTKKRSDVASKAVQNEEVELVEAGQDRQFHSFWAERTSRQIALLKKRGKAVPDSLRMKYQKHKQAIDDIKAGKGTQIAAEGVDFATAKSDRGNFKTYTKYGPDGRIKLIKRREARGEIKIGEAIDKENMMQDSIDKLKCDPLVSKVKMKLPPSQGLKPVGGDDQTHANMAEEKLNRLYESLSEKNKVKFMEKLDTEEGFDQLIKFAEEQGF